MKTIIIDGIEYNLTPKVLFKKGDFVVIQETTYLISKIEGINVTLFCNGRECLFDIDVLKNARLWDISKDVKDGDVLSYKDEISLYRHNIKNCTKQETTFGGFVYYCCYDGKRFVVDSLYSLTEQDKMDIHPATKEQHETLFKVMADAGYTFDFDKKELKKIEQNPTQEVKPFEAEHGKYYYCIKDYFCGGKKQASKGNVVQALRGLPIMGLKDASEYFLPVNFIKCYSTWSEEDEYIIEEIEAIIDAYVLEENNPKALIDWLKSLRPQNTWKPSDEQTEALDGICSYIRNKADWEISQDTIHQLYSLSEQLKKLKDEK